MAKKFHEAKAMKRLDGHLIKEDRSAPCLLPQGVIDKQFESMGIYGGSRLPDLYMGVQKQMKEDRVMLNKARSPGKY